MDYSEYYRARKIVKEIMTKDLMGPVKDDELLFGERPLEYYIVGKLYPQGVGYNSANRTPSEDCGVLDDEAGVTLSSIYNPSSFGISFSINGDTDEIHIDAAVAMYDALSIKEACKDKYWRDGDYKKSTTFWKRKQLKPISWKLRIKELSVGKTEKISLDEGLSIRAILHKVYDDGSMTITVSMVNDNQSDGDYLTDCLNAFFQPSLSITSPHLNAFRDVRRNINLSQDPEIMELEMLYKESKDFASGHGCAVNWEYDDIGNVRRIYSQFMPTYEVLQMMPSDNFNDIVLQMIFIAEGDKNEVLAGLKKLTAAYSQWIDLIENDASAFEGNHKIAAERNIKKCRNTLDVLNKSIDSLNDGVAYRAFQLANEAMFLQRKKMLIKTGNFTSDNDIKWYPFQLAFFLQEICSFADSNSEERTNVDLLWFPTGGGKTEAYLGIAAFVIFLRRVRNGPAGAGVTVLMRYTLRLLSFQQFERAAALICACEILRKKYEIEGGEIGIGLWAGKALTPNKISMAQKILNGEKDSDAESSNPAQIEKCPWCGKPISLENYECDITNKRMLIHCSDSNCDFAMGLPVYLIDEEIYEHTPSFIVATIDKFAQLAQNYETSALFGRDGVFPPDLIIQDELHLISGPLGTITGLYEAAIKKLCEKDGRYPKIVASTATIRNAEEQIKSLYASPYTQFPPQGININDSFFAKISTKDKKPARMYMGCMGTGASPTTIMIRVMSSILYATRYLAEQGFDEKVVDSFWTITNYFNTLRELGGAIIRVVDDIQDRYAYLRATKFLNTYPIEKGHIRYDKYKELTSREKSENIGNVIQNELKEPYKADGSTDPYDFILASNMISVGVDVGRLGAMVVVGQPKTTSEYIQATSRVGRETPGFVATIYNQSKSRDRSHFEKFTQYHETFYRYVEATSVTPFSDRARSRALQALYVILCRNTIPSLALDSDAVNYSRDIPELKEIREYIGNYIKLVDPSEYEHAMNDLDEIEFDWENKAERRDRLGYRLTKYSKAENSLFDPDYMEGSRFRVLNTMRSVETTVKVITREDK